MRALYFVYSNIQHSTVPYIINKFYLTQDAKTSIRIAKNCQEIIIIARQLMLESTRGWPMLVPKHVTSVSIRNPLKLTLTSM